jgi:hypothetical protein
VRAGRTCDLPPAPVTVTTPGSPLTVAGPLVRAPAAPSGRTYRRRPLVAWGEPRRGDPCERRGTEPASGSDAMRILHPTDFSHTAELARALALDCRPPDGRRMHVVHVQERFLEATAALPAAQVEGSTRSCSASSRRSAPLETRLAPAACPARGGRRDQRARLGRHAARAPPPRRRARPRGDGRPRPDPFDDVFLGGIAGRLVRRTRPRCSPCATRAPPVVRRLLVATDFKEAALAAWTFANGSPAGRREARARPRDRRARSRGRRRPTRGSRRSRPGGPSASPSRRQPDRRAAGEARPRRRRRRDRGRLRRHGASPA